MASTICCVKVRVSNSLSPFESWIKFFRLGNTLVAYFVEGIWGVKDEFSKENLLVGVEGVDDEGHQLLNVRAEGEHFLKSEPKPDLASRLKLKKSSLFSKKTY